MKKPKKADGFSVIPRKKVEIFTSVITDPFTNESLLDHNDEPLEAVVTKEFTHWLWWRWG